MALGNHFHKDFNIHIYQIVVTHISTNASTQKLEPLQFTKIFFIKTPVLNALPRKEACFQCSKFEEDFYEKARTLCNQRCSVVNRHDGLWQLTGRRQAEAFRSDYHPEPIRSGSPWTLKLCTSPNMAE